MLLDRLCDPQENPQFGPMMQYLTKDCRIVRIHDDVVEQVMAMTGATTEAKLKKLAPFTVWPDFETWIEFSIGSMDFGFVFYGKRDKSVTTGYGMLILRSDEKELRMVPMRFDMANYQISHGQFAKDFSSSDIIRHGGSQSDTLLRLQAEEALGDPIQKAVNFATLSSFVKPILFGALAFMNSPKIIRRDHIDLAKLNKARTKRGKYPYHPHHVVRLNIDKHVLKAGQPTGAGAPRGQSFVRSHLRFLVHPRYKHVEVVLVQPHYRGDPSIAIRKTHYEVDRAGSAWKD